jgi:hypothetical protein
MTTPEQELLDTIEEIRKQKFPELPAELVKQIALIEKDFTDNRQEAFKRISNVIDEHLNNNPAAKKAEG